jgi:hypothetical protein
MANKQMTVGPKEGAVAGVIAMGIFTVFIPMGVINFNPADPFLTLWAMNVLVGCFTIGSGIAVLRAKD